VEPPVAFRVRDHERPGLEVRVNFGVFAQRQATPAEIDDLARALRELVPSFEIVAEERHEFGGDVEAALHQVVVAIAAADDEVAIGVVAAAERWAKECFEVRRSDLGDF
jgi:2-keto-4-pentenoate hydratase